MSFEDWLVEHARVSSKPRKRTTMDDKLAFFQQMATLVASGTPLLEAIQISASQSQSITMREVLEEIAARVAAGCPFHSAAANYPEIFQNHWLEVIRTGEITGKMSTVLADLVRQVSEARETRRKVTGALVYPAVLLVVAVAALITMLGVVVPTFAAMFRDMGGQLPEITQFVMDASDFVVQYGVFMLCGLAAAVVGIVKYVRSDNGRRWVAAVGIATPMVGELMVQSSMYRFASNIALLLKSGVPMLEALSVLQGIFQSNPIYRDAIARAQSRVAAGRSLADSLEDVGLFTSMVTSMVRVGEESAQLAAVMEQVAPYYKERMEGLVSKFTKLLEPVIIVGMGGTIAVLMMSIYMPMFEMAGTVR